MNHLSEEELIAHAYAYAEDDSNAVQQHLVGVRGMCEGL